MSGRAVDAVMQTSGQAGVVGRFGRGQHRQISARSDETHSHAGSPEERNSRHVFCAKTLTLKGPEDNPCHTAALKSPP